MKRLVPKVLRQRNRERLNRRRAQRAMNERAEILRQRDMLLLERDGLKWRRGNACPKGLYDAGTVRIGRSFYVIGGYTQLSEICSLIHVFDLKKERWTKVIQMPDDLAQTHCALDSDGKRFIYFVSGQIGAECRPAVDHVHSYDTRTGKWRRLPSLPQARYAGTVRVWRGRLHFVGGAEEDRWTPTSDHWSLGVKNGQSTDAAWQSHTPIPVPAMHRGSVIVDDQFYVLGGRQSN